MAVQLDAQAFKALSSSTRVALLKKLGAKPRSLSSLAEEAGLSVQATDEHMHKLMQAGLVEKDKKSKWAYFRLTDSGRSLVSPDRQPVYLMLAVSMMLLLASAITWMQTPAYFSGADYDLLPQAKQILAISPPESKAASDAQASIEQTAGALNAQPVFGTPKGTASSSESVEPEAAPAPNEQKIKSAEPSTAAELPWPLLFAVGGILSLAVAIRWWKKQGV